MGKEKPGGAENAPGTADTGRGGDMAKPSDEERFWSRVDRRGPDECWPWTGSRNPAGYGAFSRGGKRSNTHRVAWEMTHGPIPGRLHVLHACDNPPCCNPAHLSLGTHEDNMADMVAKGRGRGRWGPPRYQPDV